MLTDVLAVALLGYCALMIAIVLRTAFQIVSEAAVIYNAARRLTAAARRAMGRTVHTSDLEVAHTNDDNLFAARRR